MIKSVVITKFKQFTDQCGFCKSLLTFIIFTGTIPQTRPLSMKNILLMPTFILIPGPDRIVNSRPIFQNNHGTLEITTLDTSAQTDKADKII